MAQKSRLTRKTASKPKVQLATYTLDDVAPSKLDTTEYSEAGVVILATSSDQPLPATHSNSCSDIENDLAQVYRNRQYEDAKRREAEKQRSFRQETNARGLIIGKIRLDIEDNATVHEKCKIGFNKHRRAIQTCRKDISKADSGDRLTYEAACAASVLKDRIATAECHREMADIYKRGMEERAREDARLQNKLRYYECSRQPGNVWKAEHSDDRHLRGSCPIPQMPKQKTDPLRAPMNGDVDELIQTLNWQFQSRVEATNAAIERLREKERNPHIVDDIPMI